MHRNIYAYTSPEAVYPDFVSLNMRDGFPVLSVRGPRKENGDCGETVEVRLSHNEMRRLFDTLRDEMTPPMMRATGQSI